MGGQNATFPRFFPFRSRKVPFNRQIRLENSSIGPEGGAVVEGSDVVGILAPAVTAILAT